jgi:hypothetical protein
MAADRTESPKERAPLLLVFGDLAPWVAALVRARPSIVARLVVAPREHIHSGAAPPRSKASPGSAGAAPSP